MEKSIKISLYLFLLTSLVCAPLLASQEFQGTVTPLDITKHGANYDAAMEGQLGYVARLGSIGKPFITQWQNDDIVIEGTPLFQYTLPYWNSMVKGYEALTKSSEQQMTEAKVNLMRYEKLLKQNATSEEIREGYLNTYVNALNTYETNKAMIQNKYENVREATFRAPYEGLMTGVFQSTGIAAGGNVIEFTQLNPIGIKIKMDRGQARKLSGKGVTIYPNSIKDPQGIIHGRTILTDDGIMFVSDNNPLCKYQNSDPDAIPHREFGLIIPFLIGTMNTYGVREDAIYSDSKGSYVWWGSGQSDVLDPYAKTSEIITVKKVYIKQSDMVRKNSGYGSIQRIEENPSLKIGDIIIVNAPAGLKDGDKIYIDKSQYVLMPGEQVKVVIND